MDHASKVKRVSEEAKDFYKQGKKFRIYHGSTNSTRAQNFKKGEIVDISDLNEVLEVNAREQFAIAEPNVPMDQLVVETLKYGMIPPVTMEFPGITVGGGIQGGAGESSSFKYGLFHNTCLELELVIGNGEIITTSPKDNPDLFYSTSASYGSLGIVTRAKIKIIPAKKYVKLNYIRTNSFEQTIELVSKSAEEKYEYIDAIIFSKDSGVVMLGNLSDGEKLPKARFSGAWDDWFFMHAQNIMSKHQNYCELIPITDYLFRYDRGGFWVGVYPYNRVKIPFNKLTRAFFNPMMHTRTLYRFLHAINITQRYFIQDFALPRQTSVKFLNYSHEKLNGYPVWICPLKPNLNEKLSAAYLDTNIVMDIGLWGKLKIDFDEFVKLNKDFESELTKLGGRKWLYAHSYYSEEEFWKVYNKDWYNGLREKYNANKTLPDIFDKTRVKEKYHFSVKKGLWEIIKSPKKLPISE